MKWAVMGWAWATCVEEEKYIKIYWCGNLKEIFRLEFQDVCGRQYYEMSHTGTGLVGVDFINLALCRDNCHEVMRTVMTLVVS